MTKAIDVGKNKDSLTTLRNVILLREISIFIVSSFRNTEKNPIESWSLVMVSIYLLLKCVVKMFL